jgi:hypothetical protein
MQEEARYLDNEVSIAQEYGGDDPVAGMGRSVLRPYGSRLFLGGAGSCRGVGVFLLETLDAASGVDQLLFAGEKRMAVRADFDAQHVTFDG